MKRTLLIAAALAALAIPAKADFVYQSPDGTKHVTHCDRPNVYGMTCRSWESPPSGNSPQIVTVPDSSDASNGYRVVLPSSR